MNSLMVRLVLALLVFLPGALHAADMPMAAGSPVAGIVFDDRPVMLPVQRNFQMAMLTVSSELGRSCGRMEAYGWRLDGDEQQRVNQIFNNTVDRIRAQGFVVESRKTKSVSQDITLFTADNQDKNLIFLWSAGDIGLVMVLCETSAPPKLAPMQETAALPQPTELSQPATMPPPFEVEREQRMAARLAASEERRPQQLTRTGKPKNETFSPVGNWVGSYTCSQGTTGATLAIASLKGDHFEGTLSFYPTVKNPYVAKGSYAVFGEYDSDSQRILVNPGAWIERPKGYYSTILIGSFDAVEETFSAFFQGITGCTSFEARLERDGDKKTPVVKAKKPAVKKAATKKPVAKKRAPAPKKVEKAKQEEPIVKEAVEEMAPKDPAPVPETKKPRASAIEVPNVEGIKIDSAAP